MPEIVPGVAALDAVSVGATHACVLAEGVVRCFGDNSDGQLGTGEIGGRRASPEVPVGLPGPAVEVSAGGWIPVAAVAPTRIEYDAPSRAHTCARLENGEVYWGGANDRGQLGDGTTIDRATPVRVQLDAPASAISAGGEHTCAIVENEVLCWGDNRRGQLGADPAVEPLRTRPARVPF
ncbi:MAG TPA: hypothetical protein VIL20_07935 [Sandaracinaceae bacterium]